MSWENVTLEDVSTKIGDGLHGTPKYDDSGEFYFINGNNLADGKIVIKEDTKRISSIEYDKIKKELNNRTILVAINGTLGNIGLYKDEPVALGKSACYININDDAEKHFIRYVLENQDFQIYARDFATGSTIKNLGLKAVRNYSFKIPPLPYQRKIASILSAYDDLIENNLKRIKLLEEKTFFRYKGIVRSEKFEEKSILDICYVTDGTHDSPKQQVDGFYLVTGKHLIGGFIDFSSAYFISEADHNKIQKRSKVVNGDLILSNIGTIGNVAIIDSPFEFSVKNVMIFKPNNSVITSLLYCYLNSDEMQTRFQQESSGTSQRFISLAYTRALKVKLPNEDILNEFHQEVSSLLKLKSILNQQNAKLREARDILLPRLMNGEIEV